MLYGGQIKSRISELAPGLYLLMCYKILHNNACLNCDDFFTRSTVDSIRSNIMKLAKPHVIFFPIVFTNIWNSLLNNIVTFNDIVHQSFKAKINMLHFSDCCQY